MTNLTPAQTAERLGLSVRTLANWRCLGIGPDYLKIGSRIMYPLAAIERFESAALVRTLA